MKRGLTGVFVPVTSAGETCRAFLPHPLPTDPPLVLDPELQDTLFRASVALGRLDGVTALLPDPALFLYSYVRKEALFSYTACLAILTEGTEPDTRMRTTDE